MHPDHRPYMRFTGKSRLERSLNSLLGLIEGISIDGRVNPRELTMLRMWLEDHRDAAHFHPFNELVPVLQRAMDDGVLDQEEREDLTWHCERLRRADYFDTVTADLQRLHALVGGIAADIAISVEEMRAWSDWLQDHEHLATCWPYDEIQALTTRVLVDGRIDPSEHTMLLDFFTEFLAVLDERTVVRPMVFDGSGRIGALCAVAPAIVFANSTFCFTGASSRYKRAEFEDVVRRFGGEPIPGVTTKLNYLVIGAEGNPCWAFACYGRKVEKAAELRRKGAKVVLVHENDFHDAVLDA
jgi:hypothetical protein